MFVLIVVGVPNLGEEGVGFGLLVEIPWWGHAFWAPMSSLEDCVWSGREFMFLGALPIKSGVKVAVPFTRLAFTPPELGGFLEI